MLRLLLVTLLASCGRIDFAELGDAAQGDGSVEPCGVTSGLIGHWTLDAADIVGSAVRDRSGNGRDGVLLGAPSPATVAARIGEGIDFTGTAAFVEVASLPFNTTPGGFNSFSLWFRNSTAGVDDGLFAAPQAAGPVAPRYDVWLTTAGGPVALCINTGAGDCFGVRKADLIGRWVHLVAVLVNGRIDGGRMYIDGVDVNATCVFSAAGVCDEVRSAMLPFRFGAGDPGYPWRGKTDDVRIYDRALTPAEVQELHGCAP